ncbi:MAG: CWC16 protein [Benniella sp.]|nr:MAG: CWC16 protein [Benniella sp.]
MSERKVLNKYFPPDFDPALIPRRKQPKDLQHKVRLMTPFSMRCNTCGEYIYKGKKFNARKETTNETYHSIKIYRLYIRCNRCAAEITFKTDPANSDYVAEKGAQRNFEPWRDEKSEIAAERQEEEENNPMKALENRTLDSKREMEIMDALDEIRTRNALNERVDADALLDKLFVTDEGEVSKRQQEEDEEDERLAREVFKDVDGDRIKRLRDDPDGPEEELSAAKVAMAKFAQPLTLPDFSAPLTKKRKQGGSLGLVKSSDSKSESSTSKSTSAAPSTLAAPKAAAATTTGSATSKSAAKPASLLSLVGDYGSDSDSE